MLDEIDANVFNFINLVKQILAGNPNLIFYSQTSENASWGN